MGKYHDSTTNYSGRTVDLLLLQFVGVPQADVHVHPDVANVPRMTTGIEKLAQRFAQLFLTQAGTVKNRDTEGTDFMTLLGSGRIYDDNTLRSAAAAANKAVFNQMRTEDLALNTPDDEMLASSTITELKLDRSTATVSVTFALVTAAGDKYVYTIPVETGV